ncbi:N,N-dimethylformamidase beta subunit family domain-containing protein [Croceicoccus sediminis]|uniref:N,N-dimethylformamidase beta subunit family domain-containing protein n=1 Tax=Croceicoccus sediminis TaxID=2571150 RepID=UPI00118452FA|nr:N,N-dimethylformamidase beta subunit family domain-containing protein [Croceicoccus sediminis]
MNEARITGYTSSLHVAPGGRIGAHLHAPGAVRVRLVELTADPARRSTVPSEIEGSFTPGMPSVAVGSCMTVDAGVPPPQAPRISLSVWPTRPARGDRQGIISWGEGHGLFLDAEGHLEAEWRGQRVRSATPLPSLRWTHCEMRFANESLHLSAQTDDGYISRECSFPAVSAVPLQEAGPFCLAAIAAGDARIGHYDGKIARPRIDDGDRPVARWELGRAPASRIVHDAGPDGRHGTLLNRPQKGMTGPDWRGNSTGWAEAPEEYDAIAFHDDDLVDADWPETFSFEVPADLPPGTYGFVVEGEEGSDCLPFFVTSPEPRAPVAFLVPLFSYLAYANERHWWGSPDIEAIAGAPLDEIVGPLERWAEGQRLLSPYDRHGDNTGVAHAGLRRPLVNMRADYVHPLLQGPHQLSGDILILDWLRQIGQPVDIVTDFCLHERGADALAGYRCVMTGSHPEYVSEQVLDALAGHTRRGGNILHMGGNAFYAVTSVFAEEGDVVEIRRGFGGTIPWQSEPGEARQAATGELSGLWRWRGRSAQRLVGTGTSAVSFGKGSAFRRTDDATADFDWMFEGVGDTVDAHGTLSGGPAGFEVDSSRHSLGTPTDTVVVASAAALGDPAFLAIEDMIATGPQAAPSCHLTYRRDPSGAQTFSAASIAWSSCLLSNGGDNDVAAMTANILRKFLEERTTQS